MSLNFQKYFLLFSCFFCISFAFSQNGIQGKGRVVIFYKSPTPVTVRLDTTLLKQSQEPLLLQTGIHIVKAWAPTKKLRIDTINVIEGKTSFCVKKLENTNEYTQYKKELLRYHMKKGAADFIVFPATCVYTGIIYSKYKKNTKLIDQHFQMQKMHDQITILPFLYPISINTKKYFIPSRQSMKNTFIKTIH